MVSEQLIWIELGKGFREPGVQQIRDGLSLFHVKEMTVSACRDLGSSGEKWQKLLINGGRYYLNVNSGSRCDLRSGWMTSGKRMALGIPLHPNRMTRKDWEQLPGIGPSLANKIEKDRQKNGDFVSIEDLARVHGIGKARISNWNRFF